MTTTSTASFEVTRVAAVDRHVFADLVAVEEPLELSVAWSVDGEPREQNITVTMRTPGDDFDLAVGFLFTEGLIRSADDVASVRHWGSANRVRVALQPEVPLDTSRLARHFYTTSACGVCGKTSIDALSTTADVLPPAAPLHRSIIEPAARALHDAQTAFRETGGVHGAALVDTNGVLLAVREDVGRHNAVDKVIGALIREGRPSFRESLLVVSSRASFEIVQKAVVAGIPALMSIGAPSSLAIDLARQFNLALIGFVRENRFNVYAGEVV
jgi:FdhD protein